MRQRNELLRRARLARPSAVRPNLPMSRQELAEAVNAYLHTTTGQVFSMDANHISKFELGEYCWPRQYYRQALRAVLDVERDSELGFYRRRRTSDDLAAAADLSSERAHGDDGVVEADALVPVSNSVPVPSMPVQVSISPGTSVVIGCLGVNPFTSIREEFTTHVVIEPGISVFVDTR
ncbi:MAG: hypothetical protein HKP61_07180 [Dactylosporangium sp.]|nr:hypothetical protein [Dactylosporangium sp.]NNJ60725.1 hypothetical protein [Dactylosporangium sp.]